MSASADIAAGRFAAGDIRFDLGRLVSCEVLCAKAAAANDTAQLTTLLAFCGSNGRARAVSYAAALAAGRRELARMIGRCAAPDSNFRDCIIEAAVLAFSLPAIDFLNAEGYIRGYDLYAPGMRALPPKPPAGAPPSALRMAERVLESIFAHANLKIHLRDELREYACCAAAWLGQKRAAQYCARIVREGHLGHLVEIGGPGRHKCETVASLCSAEGGVAHVGADFGARVLAAYDAAEPGAGQLTKPAK